MFCISSSYYVTIGGICRKCLNHVIVLNEAHLNRILYLYFEYYHDSRPHLSLVRNSPTPREVDPPSLGEVISIRQVGGLHHRYLCAAWSGDFGPPARFVAAGPCVMVKQPDLRGTPGFFAAVPSVAA